MQCDCSAAPPEFISRAVRRGGTESEQIPKARAQVAGTLWLFRTRHKMFCMTSSQEAVPDIKILFFHSPSSNTFHTSPQKSV